MLAIIQETLKKINSEITSFDIISLYVTIFSLSLFLLYEDMYKNKPQISDFYTTSQTITSLHNKEKTTIFGSVHGETYTFSWCKGVRIKDENKVFFRTEDEAQASGRRLSKLCQ